MRASAVSAGGPVVVEDHSGFLDGSVSHETSRRYEDNRIRSAWMANAHGVTHDGEPPGRLHRGGIRYF